MHPKNNVLNLNVISELRQPGIRRTLTLAFFAVVLVVATTLPVTLYSVQQIRGATEEARLTTTSLRTVAVFQRNIGEVGAAARDYATKPSDQLANQMTEQLQTALDAARCVANPAACSGELDAGIMLPEEDAKRWDLIVTSAADAKSNFENNLETQSPQAAVEEFDNAVKEAVDEPAKTLTERVAQRGVDAQESINTAIARSTMLSIIVIVLSILLAVVLAVVIPNRFMNRMNHLRAVSHQLATGTLTARVNPRWAKRNDEVGDLIVDFNIMAMALQQQDEELRNAQGQLRIKLKQEQERATTDPLTGLRNHSYFQESLHNEMDRCRRTGRNVTIAVLDLDNFKQVNDRFGHSEGDAVLRRATKGIADNLRPYDLACRLGGEEFGIIFPETTAEQAMIVLDRIAAHIKPFGPNGEQLTYSGGVATFPLHADSQADLFKRADEASYTAKMQGKNASVIYDPAKVTSMDSEERTKQRSRDAMLTTATTLVSAVDQKDPYTRNHSELVSIYAATIARAMRLDESTVKLVYRAALLHDVGKIGIADSILQKDTQLSHDEWVQLRMHPEFSYRILLAADMEPVATWTRHHHEHFDGTGYPHQLKGNDIPIGSRIILVADAFESMTSDHIYRRALGINQAIHELRAGAGAQFDPQIVEIMIALVQAGTFKPIMEQYGRLASQPEIAQVSADEQAPAAIGATVQSAALDGTPPDQSVTKTAPVTIEPQSAQGIDTNVPSRKAQAEATAWAQAAIEHEGTTAEASTADESPRQEAA